MPSVEPASQGELISTRLAELEMSVSEFARRLEVRPSFIYSVMKGQRRITLPSTVERAAEVLGISTDTLERPTSRSFLQRFIDLNTTVRSVIG